MEKVEVRIKKEYENLDIKEFLKQCNVGRGKIESIRVNKKSYLNDVYAPLESIIKANDLLTIYFEEEINIKEYNFNLDIVYEDDYLIAVNKPPSMLVHQDMETNTKTLVNAMASYYKSKGISRQIRYLYRIDFETSGLVLFAKDFLTEAILLKSDIDKNYLALIKNAFQEKEGTLNLLIGKDRHNSNKMCVTNNGKEAITNYQTVKFFKGYSLVNFKLVTGRTHQIRVSASYFKHPLLGDTLYGGEKTLIDRVALHCYMLSFIHPITNEKITITCDVPNDIQKLII